MLNRVPLFGGVSKRGMKEIAKIADEIDLPAGKELIREGDPGRQFFVLLDGEAEVRRKGRKVNTLGAGDFFGEMALIDGEPRSATVVAVSDVYVMTITRAKFLKLLESEPKIALAIMATLTRRLRDVQAAASL